MAERISTVNEFSPAGTVLSAATTNSNSIKTEAARDARVYADVTAKIGTTLDIAIQISFNNTDWFTVASFTQITAVGNYVHVLSEKEIGTYMRLQYVAATNTFTLGSTLEVKTGT